MWSPVTSPFFKMTGMPEQLGSAALVARKGNKDSLTVIEALTRDTDCDHGTGFDCGNRGAPQNKRESDARHVNGVQETMHLVFQR